MNREQGSKKEYQAPRLETLGPVAELTQLGGTIDTGDTLHGESFGGSVHHTPNQ